MNKEENYFEINRNAWNNKTEIHIQSEFYAVDEFIKGKNSLNEIELKLLGDVKGKSILHLQCHFGQDTISLSRLGAIATGVDISDRAIEKAGQIAKETGSDTRFICCNVYDLPNHSQEQFDIVFTSYGTIGWLPDLNKWAHIISTYLKPGGKFIFVEFHPVVWMFDNDFSNISYNYFNTGAIIETESGTYADQSAAITQELVGWNHSLSEVVNSLIKNGLEINSLDEFDYSPYHCFKQSEEIEKGKYRIQHLGNKIPMLYSVLATKKNYI